MKNEYIVCPAVEVDVICTSMDFSGAPEPYIFKVNEWEEYKNDTLLKCYLQEVGDAKFGFFTTENRFVDPEEAVKIAIEAGQVKNIRKEAFKILINFRLWSNAYFKAYPNLCPDRRHRISDLESRHDIKLYRELQKHPLYKRRNLKSEDLCQWKQK